MTPSPPSDARAPSRSTTAVAVSRSGVTTLMTSEPRNSSTGPAARRRPRPMTAARSQTCSTSAKRWDEEEDRPAGRRHPPHQLASAMPDASSPFVGSSRMSSAGSFSSACATPEPLPHAVAVGLHLARVLLVMATVSSTSSIPARTGVVLALAARRVDLQVPAPAQVPVERLALDHASHSVQHGWHRVGPRPRRAPRPILRSGGSGRAASGWCRFPCPVRPEEPKHEPAKPPTPRLSTALTSP